MEGMKDGAANSEEMSRLPNPHQPLKVSWRQIRSPGNKSGLLETNLQNQRCPGALCMPVPEQNPPDPRSDEQTEDWFPLFWP